MQDAPPPAAQVASPAPAPLKPSVCAATESGYLPLSDTLRIYAGWLLAFLFVIFAAGSYQYLRALPLENELLSDWVTSQLVLNVAATTFTFLLLSSLHRALGKSVWLGILCTAIGFALIVLFRANI
jgi:hypothetical protein